MNDKKYNIYINNTKFEVSEEIYKEYYKDYYREFFLFRKRQYRTDVRC